MKNSPKIINAWCLYDWANSVHGLVIVSTIFPIYYGSVAVSVSGSDFITFLGFPIKNTVLFSYAISASFLIVAFTTPILTAIADYSGNKKFFMKFFVYLGSFTSIGLFFFTSETISISVFLFALSLIGYSGSIVFYNAYLPEIATEDRYDNISAKGYALGYIGSVLLLLFNLSMLLMPNWYGGISSGLAARISFLTTGIWWWSFAQYTFYHLPNSTKQKEKKGNWLFKGFEELKKVLKELPAQPLLITFLIAFFFYNMGVQTVMYVATIFGQKELNLPDEVLIITILILQILAIFGSYGFSKSSKILGNSRALLLGVLVWIGICIGAYFVYTEMEFYILATTVGFVMGGIQSLSRSTYAKLMPLDTPDRASYFGFYDVVDKITIVLGTFSYGFIDQFTGSMRNSIIALALYFLIALVFLAFIPSKKTFHKSS